MPFQNSGMSKGKDLEKSIQKMKDFIARQPKGDFKELVLKEVVNLAQLNWRIEKAGEELRIHLQEVLTVKVIAALQSGIRYAVKSLIDDRELGGLPLPTLDEK